MWRRWVRLGVAGWLGLCALVAALPAAAWVIDAGGHTAPLRRLAADPSGRFLVTAGDDQAAIVWRLADARPLHTLRFALGDDEGGRLYGAAVSPDGRTVAVGGSAGGTSRIVLFDLASGAFRAAFEPQPGGLRNLAWSADGARLAAVYVGRPALRVFAVGGALLHEAPLPADVYGLSWTAAGQIVVTAFDGRLRFFRAGPDGVQPEGEVATSVGDPVGVRHSPDGRLVAVGHFSRAAGGAVVVDVFDATSRQRVRRFDFTDLPAGNLMSVAWQADGRALLAAGTALAARGQAVVRRIAWPGGEVDGTAVAGEGVVDFAALADGSVVYAGLDGGWGRLAGLAVTARGEAPLLRVAEPGALRTSADGRVVDWRSAAGTRHSLAWATRGAGIGTGDERATVAAVTETPDARIEGWDQGRAPRLGGLPVALPAGEVSRAAGWLPDGSGAVFATTRALRRVGRDAQAVWTVPLPAEARALAVAGDGRSLVVALADGTLRWHRSADGAPLASLLPLRDGRWAVWTDAGWFDAGPGAEDIVGRLVPRAGGVRADFFGASRWRDGWRRPDVIDHVLAERDLGLAVQQADEARRAAGLRSAPPPAMRATRPPVVTLAGAPQPAAAGGVELGIDLFVPGGGAPERLLVRTDARPAEARFMPGADGATSGRLTVPRPGARTQVFVAGAHGVSMPAGFDGPAPERAPGRLHVVVAGAGAAAADLARRLDAASVAPGQLLPALSALRRTAADDAVLVYLGSPGVAGEPALAEALAAIPARVLLVADLCGDGAPRCDPVGLANRLAAPEHGVAVVAAPDGLAAALLAAFDSGPAAAAPSARTLARQLASRPAAVLAWPEALPDFALGSGG